MNTSIKVVVLEATKMILQGEKLHMEYISHDIINDCHNNKDNLDHPKNLFGVSLCNQ